jgi:hypothetical protein
VKKRKYLKTDNDIRQFAVLAPRGKRTFATVEDLTYLMNNKAGNEELNKETGTSSIALDTVKVDFVDNLDTGYLNLSVCIQFVVWTSVEPHLNVGFQVIGYCLETVCHVARVKNVSLISDVETVGWYLPDSDHDGAAFVQRMQGLRDSVSLKHFGRFSSTLTPSSFYSCATLF